MYLKRDLLKLFIFCTVAVLPFTSNQVSAENMGPENNEIARGGHGGGGGWHGSGGGNRGWHHGIDRWERGYDGWYGGGFYGGVYPYGAGLGIGVYDYNNYGAYPYNAYPYGSYYYTDPNSSDSSSYYYYNPY